MCILLNLQSRSSVRVDRDSMTMIQWYPRSSLQDKECMLIDPQSSRFRHYNMSKTLIPFCLCMSQGRKVCIFLYPFSSSIP